MSLKSKLNRMKAHLTRETPPPAPAPSLVDIPFLDKWAELQAKPVVVEDDFCMVREVRYGIEHRHGKYAFRELYEVMEAWAEKGIHHPLSSASRRPEELLFFDTETTGLHGGAGNAIFLLGYSRMEGDSVAVRQHFLAAPHAEVALYQSFLADIKASTQLVTYNGKAFDWPQVKTRHTLIRNCVAELPSFGHYDLLHGARRLWKEELESCRLSVIEQAKLGVHRKDDVPGYLAPILYFDYLANKDPDTIKGVLHHNEIDVLSLITLYIHVSKLLLEHEKESVSHQERYEIFRWYEALGADEIAIAGYHQIAASDHPCSGKAKLALGHLYKKRKDWERAVGIWEEYISEHSYIPEEVYIEAAKIYEHQKKDYEKALHYTRLAWEAGKKKGSILRQKSKVELEKYQKRIERLQRKKSIFLRT